MKPTRLFLDLDGVITDFVTAACSLHGFKNPYTGLARGKHLGNDNLCGILNMQPDDFYGRMDYEFWRHLPSGDDAGLILRKLTSYFLVEQVCVLTSPIHTRGCLDGKRDWINDHLPDFRGQYLIGGAKHFCASPNALLIDDMDKNVDKWRRHGGVAILIPRPWNRAGVVGHGVEKVLSFELGNLFGAK